MPPDKIIRKRRVSVYLSDKELQAVTEAADELGVNMTSYIRIALKKAIEAIEFVKGKRKD